MIPCKRDRFQPCCGECPGCERGIAPNGCKTCGCAVEDCECPDCDSWDSVAGFELVVTGGC
jgi:hypothetical protein